MRPTSYLDLYHRDDDDLQNCYDFWRAMEAAGFSGMLEWADKNGGNPWHVQIRTGGRIFNFWPHRLRGHVQYSKAPSVIGAKECVQLIKQTLEDDFEVIEEDTE